MSLPAPRLPGRVIRSSRTLVSRAAVIAQGFRDGCAECATLGLGRPATGTLTPPDPPPLRTSVYSASVVAPLPDPLRFPPPVNVRIWLVQNCSPCAYFGRVDRGEAHRFSTGIGLLGTRMGMILAPAVRVRTSCSAGLLDFREAACIPSIAGPQTAQRWSGRSPTDFEGASLPANHFM